MQLRDHQGSRFLLSHCFAFLIIGYPPQGLKMAADAPAIISAFQPAASIFPCVQCGNTYCQKEEIG